jgi:hypothetical protein
MKKPPDPHYRHRFPAELISHGVWLYHVFSLSFRDVELLLSERGIFVSYESISGRVTSPRFCMLSVLLEGSYPTLKTRPRTLRDALPVRR